AILYADTITRSMRAAMDETDRRRAKQVEYNIEHGITPKSVQKKIADILEGAREPAPGRARSKQRGMTERMVAEEPAGYASLDAHAAAALIRNLEAQMYKHAQNLEFEEAARQRDEIRRVREKALMQ
ncbi:MAG TPA: UvrB/UvrC motif-containing protein, partial [Rhodanobacteraceae bacterium]|nr:UvrB/UvrC motif-containing protein [Rhodanobacteraceae bacterium]